MVVACASNRAAAFTGSRIICTDGPGRLDESSRHLIKQTSDLYSHEVTIQRHPPPPLRLRHYICWALDRFSAPTTLHSRVFHQTILFDFSLSVRSLVCVIWIFVWIVL